jgi:hypothetical protein
LRFQIAELRLPDLTLKSAIGDLQSGNLKFAI